VIARRVINACFWIATLAAGALSLLPMLHIIASTVINGMGIILQTGIEFFTGTPEGFLLGGKGGIGPSIIGTLITVCLATILAVPVALCVGIFVVEWPMSLLSRVVRTMTSLILEVPTIIISIVVYAVIVIPMHTFSALAASIALFIVMLPYVITGIENALRSVPSTYREAGYALGLSRAAILAKVVLRIAGRGILASFIMGVAKAAGETAPLLFTAGGLRSTYPETILGPIDAIPLLIYDYILSPYDICHKVAWGAALVLLLILLTLFTLLKIFVKEVKM